jgi:hypothetical protein
MGRMLQSNYSVRLSLMKCWKSRSKSYPPFGREQRAVYESPGSKELWLCLSLWGGFSFHSQSRFKQVIITTLIEYHIYEKTDRWRTVFSNIGPIEQSDNLGLGCGHHVRSLHSELLHTSIRDRLSCWGLRNLLLSRCTQLCCRDGCVVDIEPHER